MTRNSPEYFRKWLASKGEVYHQKRREYGIKYRIKNRDLIRRRASERLAKFRQEHPESYKTDWKYTKEICRFCGAKDVPLMKSSKKNGRQYLSCRKCNLKLSKNYRKTKKGRINQYKATYKSITKYPEKQKARIALYQAKCLGKIKKPKVCSFCGMKGRITGHHKDYSKPLEVRWLCTSCHRLADKGLI